jgi:hypothetical protein
MTTIARPEPSPFEAEWDGPDADGWHWAGTPGGGVLIVKPRASGGWVPVWTAPSGHILWHGGPLPALEAAQRAAEDRVTIERRIEIRAPHAWHLGPVAGDD